MNASRNKDISTYKTITIDYDQVRAIIEAIAESIEDNAQDKIMDATIRAAGNDAATISMAMAIVPQPDIKPIIDPSSKYAKPVYFFRSEHGAELNNDPIQDLILEMGYLLRQYDTHYPLEQGEMEENEKDASGVIFDIGNQYRSYFTILCVIDYDDDEDADEKEFSERAKNMLLALKKSISNTLASIPNESLEISYWGTFDGLPIVECVRR